MQDSHPTQPYRGELKDSPDPVSRHSSADEAWDEAIRRGNKQSPPSKSPLVCALKSSRAFPHIKGEATQGQKAALSPKSTIPRHTQGISKSRSSPRRRSNCTQGRSIARWRGGPITCRRMCRVAVTLCQRISFQGSARATRLAGFSAASSGCLRS